MRQILVHNAKRHGKVGWRTTRYGNVAVRQVDSLGGGIALENVASTGSSGLRITIRLPIAEAAAERPE